LCVRCVCVVCALCNGANGVREHSVPTGGLVARSSEKNTTQHHIACRPHRAIPGEDGDYLRCPMFEPPCTANRSVQRQQSCTSTPTLCCEAKSFQRAYSNETHRRVRRHENTTDAVPSSNKAPHPINHCRHTTCSRQGQVRVVLLRLSHRRRAGVRQLAPQYPHCTNWYGTSHCSTYRHPVHVAISYHEYGHGPAC
jgi:hypothetical protein